MSLSRDPADRYPTDQTRQYPAGSQGPTTSTAGQWGNYAPQYRGEPRLGPSEQPVSLIAGRFELKHVAINLAVLAVLAWAITFAAVLVAIQIVDWVAELPAETSSAAVSTAVSAGFIAAGAVILAGLLYIPVVGTGNESLFFVAIAALAVAVLCIWVISDGLLDQQWQAIIAGVIVLCVGISAGLAPARINAADTQ